MCLTFTTFNFWMLHLKLDKGLFKYHVSRFGPFLTPSRFTFMMKRFYFPHPCFPLHLIEYDHLKDPSKLHRQMILEQPLKTNCI